MKLLRAIIDDVIIEPSKIQPIIGTVLLYVCLYLLEITILFKKSCV